MNPYQMSQDTLDAMKAAMTNPVDGMHLMNSGAPLQKAAIGTGSGLVGYDLQAPARLLIPFITPLRNALPRRSRAANPGVQSNWKQITALTDGGYLNMGPVNEGARAPQVSFSATNKSAAYVTLGAEDSVNFEAQSASQGYDDAIGTATLLTMQQMMVKEEFALLGGNNSIALGTASTPSTSASGTGGTIPSATYTVRVVALTLEGYNNSSVAGGVATQKVVTTPDGKTMTINGGSSIRSATASQAITLGEKLLASTTVKNGAVAYAWFIGTGGTEYLQAITTINSVSLSAYSTSTQTSAAFTVDYSQNNGSTGGGTNQVTQMDGIMTNVYSNFAASNAQVVVQATGTAGVGTALTASGAGTIVEIDNLLVTLWNLYRTSPDVMWVNAQEQRTINKLCVSTASGTLLSIRQGASDAPYRINAGGTVEGYFNPFSVTGGQYIQIRIHPNVPPGTIFFQTTQLPGYYVSNATPNVAEVLTRRDYYRIDWPLTTREYQYGVYSEEVLAVYAPFTNAILTNIPAS